VRQDRAQQCALGLPQVLDVPLRLRGGHEHQRARRHARCRLRARHRARRCAIGSGGRGASPPAQRSVLVVVVVASIPVLLVLVLLSTDRTRCPSAARDPGGDVAAQYLVGGGGARAERHAEDLVASLCAHGARVRVAMCALVLGRREHLEELAVQRAAHADQVRRQRRLAARYASLDLA